MAMNLEGLSLSVLSREVANTQYEIVELQADDPEANKTVIQSLLDYYHQGIKKLKELGINYRDRFQNESK